MRLIAQIIAKDCRMLADLAHQARDILPRLGLIHIGPIVTGRALVRNNRLKPGNLAGIERVRRDESGDGQTTLPHLLKHGGIFGRPIPRHDGEEVGVGRCPGRQTAAGCEEQAEANGGEVRFHNRGPLLPQWAGQVNTAIYIQQAFGGDAVGLPSSSRNGKATRSDTLRMPFGASPNLLAWAWPVLSLFHARHPQAFPRGQVECSGILD